MTLARRLFAFVVVVMGMWGISAETSTPAHAWYWSQIGCGNTNHYSDGASAALANKQCRRPTATVASSDYGGSGLFFNLYNSNHIVIGIGSLHCDLGEVLVRDTTGGEAKCVTEDTAILCKAKEGNPVTVQSGNKEQRFVDWTSGGAFPLTLERNFTSYFLPIGAPSKSSFGYSWRSNFDATALYANGTIIGSPAAINNRIHITLPNATEYHFTYLNSLWQPVTPQYNSSASSTTASWSRIRTDANYSITVLSDRVEFRSPDDTLYTFDSSGKLASIRMPSGITQLMTYATVGLSTQLSKVTDSLGRSITFTYGPLIQTYYVNGPLITKATMSDGKEYLYTYDTPFAGALPEGSRFGLVLKTVTFPDATPAVTTDNPKHIYAYQPADGVPNLTLFGPSEQALPLTSMTDEKGIVFATWAYADGVHVSSSQHAGNT
jgi:Domain of unknown function (DUF6531)